MPTKYAPEAIEHCFGLFLKYSGENLDSIEREMRAVYPGWTKQVLFSRGQGEHFRAGWIEKYGWEAALKIYLSTKGQNLQTSGERLLSQVETIRDRLFEQIIASGVNNRDLVYQHEKYAARSAEILEQLDKASNPLRDFATFWKFLLKHSLEISPSLARELVNAEDAILKRAKNEFA